MTRLTAKWLPGGSIELAPIPMRGKRELAELNLAVSELQTAIGNLELTKLGFGLLSARDCLKRMGAEETKKIWDDYCRIQYVGEPDVIQALTWPTESFETTLASTIDLHLYRKLNVSSDEALHTKLKAMNAEAEEKLKTANNQPEKMGMINLVYIYWRLRNTGLATINLPSGPITIDWSLANQGKTLDLLAEVVTEEDMRSLRAEKNKPFDMNERFSPQTVADVEGKSETNSKPSTASVPASTPSLGSPMEMLQPSR